jgi:hypothetical protein
MKGKKIRAEKVKKKKRGHIRSQWDPREGHGSGQRGLEDVLEEPPSSARADDRKGKKT